MDPRSSPLLSAAPGDAFLKWDQYSFESMTNEYSSLYPDQIVTTPPYIRHHGVIEYGDPDFTQTPTPMQSHSPSPILEDGMGMGFGSSMNDTQEENSEPEFVSVSTAFHPSAHLVSPDTVFSSSDGVLFYVHFNVILSSSPRAFHAVLGAPLSDQKFREVIIHIADASSELNVILHMLYGTSCAQHSPSLDTLVRAVDRMPVYSIQPDEHIIPPSALYSLLLSHAPLHPLEVYALGGHHNLSALCTNTSAHLLSCNLSTIGDGMAERMGAIFLKRLLLLHVERFAKLRDILLPPPHPHAPTRDCGFEDQKGLKRAWALVSAYLAWDARPDLSTHSMQSALEPLMEHLTCTRCRDALKNRMRDVITQWASVQRTI
ncbi:hypothetical protein B0H34DRAFT_121070 [Crassisporium funariophilum]|nr:hypothetical protein B0H34DRAFT_121070 [Crassisporium funariophilum]